MNFFEYPGLASEGRFQVLHVLLDRVYNPVNSNGDRARIENTLGHLVLSGCSLGADYGDESRNETKWDRLTVYYCWAAMVGDWWVGWDKLVDSRKKLNDEFKKLVIIMKKIRKILTVTLVDYNPHGKRILHFLINARVDFRSSNASANIDASHDNNNVNLTTVYSRQQNPLPCA